MWLMKFLKISSKNKIVISLFYFFFFFWEKLYLTLKLLSEFNLVIDF